MVCTGTASALRKLIMYHYPEDMANSVVERGWLVCTGSLVAVAWIILPFANEHMMTVDLGSVPLLTINAFSGATAMLMGASILRPMDTHLEAESQEIAVPPLQGIHDAMTLLLLTGITGCCSNISIRRSYISWYQFVCFLLAALCVGCRATQDTAWSLRKRRRDNGGNYELVTDSTVSQSDDDPAALIEDPDVHQFGPRLLKPQSTTLYTFLSSVTVLLWTAYLLLNFTERVYPRVNTLLDRRYEASLPLEVVIAMYAEPTSEVADLISNMKAMPAFSEAEFTIYFKGEMDDQSRVEQETGATNVTMLPNVGREAETYLNHILTRWDSLAKQTIFLQANIHNPREFYPHLRNYFRPERSGFLSLSWSGAVCNRDSCGDKFSWQDETEWFSTIQDRINSADTSRNILLSYKGQFMVSAARIRGIDKTIYEDIWHAFVDENSWAHQDEYLKGRKDSMSEPFFGYTVERMWNMLFQCSDMEVAWKCPSLVSGWRFGGDINDCQCFD